MYNWTETRVGGTDRQECFFGSKDDDFPNDMIANATRKCISHEEWMMYDSTQCLSEDSYRLRMIAEVHMAVINCQL